MIPPRTANCPRRSTRSHRSYPKPTRRCAAASGSSSPPGRRTTGSAATTSAGRTCISARTGAITTSGRSTPRKARITDKRVPTMSAEGVRRSWGSVSQAGNSATDLSGAQKCNSPRIRSASRLPGVTTRIGPRPPATPAIAAANAPGGTSKADGWTPAIRRANSWGQADGVIVLRGILLVAVGRCQCRSARHLGSGRGWALRAPRGSVPPDTSGRDGKDVRPLPRGASEEEAGETHWKPAQPKSRSKPDWSSAT